MICGHLHAFATSLPLYSFDFETVRIPKNGIYILFEEGETAHDGNRIVRIGTHTGQDQLRSRLRQHFLVPNKDRSIFRKNIGRALLTKDKDPFIADWEIDLTPSAARTLHGGRINKEKYLKTESAVTDYMQHSFSFVVIPVEKKEDRLRLEAAIISAVATCTDCGPSATWLGNYSPKQKIRESGLWQVNELGSTPLDEEGLLELRRLSES